MTKTGRIAVLGEALLDIVPDGAGARAVPGGSGLNTALALARLGAPATYCGTLSRDADGAQLADNLAREGVDLSCTFESARRCPRVIVTPGADGAPHYDLHLAGSALDDAPAQWRVPRDVAHVHATSFASIIGPSGDAALETLKQARASVSTSFDPNVRTAVLPSRAETHALLAARIAQADIVKASEEDLALLTSDPDSLLRDWRSLGPRLVIVTRGARGALALFENESVEIAAPVVPVCDTVGAGDTFMAALLAAMQEEGVLLRGLGAFERRQIVRWLSFATHAAALCCMRAGADPPHRNMIGARQ